jgi:hypothetical protein
MEKKSFQKGWFKIPQGNVAAARVRLMATLGVTTRAAFRDRMNGKVNHTEDEILAIEEIFSAYGIADIWGTV